MKSFLLFACACFLSTQAFGFGIAGSDGSSGRSGQDGKAGEDVTALADGAPRAFYLNGGDGTPGGRGQDGSSAYACHYTEGHGNEYGADGGDGGNGGRGGSGARGGDATIFYADVADLKKITIENQGGLGAPGGYGARPGQGCQCYSSSWSRESCRTTQSCTTTRVCRDTGETRTGPDGRTAPARVCHDRRRCVPQTTCTTKTYYCRSGSSGRSGGDGSHGSNGRWGRISLVKNLESLPAQFPKASFGVTKLSQDEILLSKRIWKKKTGARALFAPSSQIQNNYREFARLAQARFRLEWKAQASIEKFKDTKFHLSFNGEKVSFKVQGEDFLKYETFIEDDTLVVAVMEAFKKSELTQLKVEGAQGHGNNLSIKIKDKAGLSRLVDNKVSLQFVHKSWFQWWVVYDQEVPAEALVIEAEQITIDVSKLGLPYKAVKQGKKVRFTVKIERSFGNNKTVVEEFFGPVKL